VNLIRNRRVKARLLTTPFPSTLDIDSACSETDVAEGESGPLAHYFAMRTDERVTIIDNSASFAAKKISVNVANAKSTRALKSYTLSNLMFAE
jgi:hypothetical protein